MIDMADDKDNQRHKDWDHELDLLLANYSAVDPRPGLEGRVLANLRREQEFHDRPTMWRWAVAVCVAAAMVLFVLLWPRPKVVEHKAAVHQTSGGQQGPTQVQTTPQELGPERLAQGSKSGARTRRVPNVVANTGHPHLDQFPSAQPLSDQERALLDYVRRSREEAVLLARARMEVLRRDREEEESIVRQTDLGSPGPGLQDQ